MKGKLLIVLGTAATALLVSPTPTPDFQTQNQKQEDIELGTQTLDLKNPLEDYKVNWLELSPQLNKWDIDRSSLKENQDQETSKTQQTPKQQKTILQQEAPVHQETPAPASQQETPKQQEQPKQQAPEQKEEQPVETQEVETPQVENPKAQKVAQSSTEQEVAPKESTQQDDATNVSSFEQQVVELTNVERNKEGLDALQLDTQLSNVAKDKSKDMQQNQYFDHTSPTYGSPFDMMKAYGVNYRSAGENIAMGQRSPEEVVQAWMNSEGHRKNIMSSSYTHIGIGHIEEGNYWTQMFIEK
ncbi:CAP domain-containing protein [Jeotgalibacillus marinus]|uniref:CAP domain-containing protein n=1 Tax=Jeotgalibacillus marinus TaxID=86667 RepID=A0ABV3Q3H8_9BACL